MEARETVGPAIFEQVAKILKVPAEAIKNFDDQTAVTIITSTINNHDNSSVYGYYNFNPLDKVIELYERMLKDKNEMIEKLENMLNKK